MSNKQQKKLRQLVRRRESELVSHSWNVFFETAAKMPFKYRLKMAWYILIKKKVY